MTREVKSGAAAVKERPILFSRDMVKAILEGRKTQTRRALRHQPLDILPMKNGVEWVTLEQREPEPKGKVARCRFGMPGERLWVKETWRTAAEFLSECSGPEDICYRASTSAFHDEFGPKWRPSIFMPRWASRITLEITEVRAQRLQEISMKDAAAEGWPGFSAAPMGPSAWFSSLWESINGKGAWSRNPWVWAVSFRRVQ